MAGAYPSYPIPNPSSLQPEYNIYPRPLLPLQTPPFPLFLPPLPSPVRSPSFTSSYSLTTHLYPSAYPHAPSAPLPRSSYEDAPGESKNERMTRQKALVHELWKRNRAHVRGEVPESRKEVLWNVVNRFVRKDAGKRRGGVTLFLAHANGFMKEIWEPSLLEIFPRAEAAGVIINEVWAFEAVQHGDSALINDNVIGDVFDWADNARDILNMLLYYLPCSASPKPLPTHLERLSEDVASQRMIAGYEDRTLVGIGHSLGGCCTQPETRHSARAALVHPALFASLILVDPVIVPIWAQRDLETKPPSHSQMAIHRRTTWGSREEALAGFQKSPFFNAWDPAVLVKYVEHGMMSNPEAGSKDAVRLKMSGTQEAVVFIDRRLSYETWQLLPQLDERIELRYILSEKDTTATGGEAAVRELAWRRARNASNVLIPSAGHLIPQEVPLEFANLVVGFLERKYGVSKAML